MGGAAPQTGRNLPGGGRRGPGRRGPRLSPAASLQRAERRRAIAGRKDMRIWCAFERIACGVRRNLRAITRVGVLCRTSCLNCRSSVDDQLFLRGRLFVAMCTSFEPDGL